MRRLTAASGCHSRLFCTENYRARFLFWPWKFCSYDSRYHVFKVQVQGVSGRSSVIHRSGPRRVPCTRYPRLSAAACRLHISSAQTLVRKLQTGFVAHYLTYFFLAQEQGKKMSDNVRQTQSEAFGLLRPSLSAVSLPLMFRCFTTELDWIHQWISVSENNDGSGRLARKCRKRWRPEWASKRIWMCNRIYENSGRKSGQKQASILLC